MTTVNTTSTPAKGNTFTLFTLTTAASWTGDQIRAAATLGGFDDTGHYIRLLDDAGAIAVIMFPLHSQVSGPIQHLDFQRGTDLERGMASQLAAALAIMAKTLDAVIHNAKGDVLALDELQAAGEAMDADVAQRLDDSDAAAEQAQSIEADRVKPVPQTDGTVRVPGALSFTYTTTTRRGRWLGEVHFDAQPLGYYEGRRKGAAMAGELLACIKAGGHTQTARIIAAALGTTINHGSHSEKSTDNVAIGFINAVSAIVESAARHVNHAGYIERVIVDSFENERASKDYEAEHQRTTGAKAATARAARRAAKATS